MLLWISAGLVAAGVVCLAFDRRVAHFFHAIRKRPWRQRVRLTTDWAKGAHWLIIAGVLYGGTQAAMALGYETPALHRVSDLSAAMLLSLAIASAILHTIKLFIGRRRPRDDFQHGFYGFEFTLFDAQHDSFPSGHALTIFCVATVLSAGLPMLAPLWFVFAAYLALTRAALTSHFLSDVMIGAALGLIVTREMFIYVFPALTPAWF
jgi:membrane-associated phospholipid phosphatase